MQQQMGFRSDQATNLILYLKLAQQQLELEPPKPWFLISETLSSVTEADQPRVLIPTTMLEEYDDGALFYVPDSGDDEDKNLELRKDEYDVLIRNYKDSETGPPEAYALRGNYFYIFPTPDDVYNLKVLIYAQDTILDSNIENKWLKYAPMLIMGKTLQLISGAPRDKDAKAIGQDWERQGRLALAAQIESRDLANQALQMGGPH